MSETKSSRASDWLIFFVSTAIMIAMMIWMPQFFWIILPVSLTFLVKAFDAM